MKKATEVKYPNSASLFQFCRRVLDHKFGGIRVIDQDVGQILGFDPADCSHWKKGKKNIRSIQAMKSIAQHLGVDERLVVDLANGELDDTEAFHEFNGYSAFALDNKIFDTAKKECYRSQTSTWTKEREQDLREAFTTREAEINRIVVEIHTAINFQEAPLYLPEVLQSYPQIVFETAETSLNDVVSVTTEQGITTIRYQAGTDSLPFTRYKIAKAMASHFLKDIFAKDIPNSELAKHIADVQTNLFAAKLLVPAALIRKELNQVQITKDIVSQLAEIFWVSKSFMNRRLRDVLQGTDSV